MKDEGRDLTQATAEKLAWVAQRLREGFTGELIIYANSGGIREVEIRTRYRGEANGNGGNHLDVSDAP